MLILWKSIQDDGAINWLETAGMVALFVLIIYFLAAHGGGDAAAEAAALLQAPGPLTPG